MRKLLIFFLLPVNMAGHSIPARAQATGQADSVVLKMPSKEEFVNAIFHTVVDSSFSKYYLFTEADTCRFVKYDYDEWIKYNLLEDVSIVVLNELARKAYSDKEPAFWKQDQLKAASCIGSRKVDSLMRPFARLWADSRLSRREKKKAFRQQYKDWQRLPNEEKKVFYFSRPEFTDDGRYAIIDLSYVLDKENGLGVTYLFKRVDTGSGWKLIGKSLLWIS